MESVVLLPCTRNFRVSSACLLLTIALFCMPALAATCVPSGGSPSVTICSPAPNASVSSPVNVSAAAKSTLPVKYLQIYLDGVKVFQVNGASLDTSLSMTAGAHRLTVQASDGTIFKTTENITVTTGTPGVTVAVSPTSASVAAGASKQFTATVSNTANTGISWFVDGVLGGNATTGVIDQANPATYVAPAANGSHIIKAVSAADNTKSASATATVTGGTGNGCTPSTTNSTVTICTPASGATVSSPVQISAVATSAAAVQFMQIYIDGTKQFQQNNVSSINTSLAMSSGSHRLTVQAYNGAYFKTTEYVTVSSAPSVSVSISPTTASIALSGSQQFTATLQNAADTSVTWSVDGTPGGSATVGTIDLNANPATYQAPATDGNHTITATSQADTSKSGRATVTVGTPPKPDFKGMFTYKYGNARLGANTSETTLTPANVKSASFGKKWTYAVDGYVYAMPLYVPEVNIGGSMRNVVYIATEHDSVYAFDADGSTTSPLWKVSFINSAAGITTIPQADVGSTIFPEIGITGTPVIDQSTNTLYVVATTKENGSYFQRLHALDITNGHEKLGGPVQIKATVKGTGDGTDGSGNVAFQPKIQLQRPALTLFKGVVYIAWASHGDNGPYHGWVMGYNATSLTQVFAHNDSPNARRGGIWMSGGGLAVDEAASALFYMSGNGTFTANTGGTAYGDSFVKLNANGAVTDYFTPFDQSNMNAHDLDLGVGAPTVLPDQPGAHPHLVVGAGKTASIYLVDRDQMGHFNSASNSQIVQYLPNVLASHCHAQPVYWNGSVYLSAETGPVYAFSLANGLLSATPDSKTANTFAFPGPNPTVSANGNADGILWAIDKPATGGAVLRAYDANDLTKQLYNSTQAGTRDTLPTAVKFVPPLVANGRVYVALKGQVAVFGLLQ